MLATNVKPVKKLTDGFFFWLGLLVWFCFVFNTCQYFPREVFGLQQSLIS